MGPLALLLVLALLQGLTEYLPVSSSGHLVLARLFLPGGERLPNDATVEVWLHLGTLGSVLLFYRREIIAILSGLMGRGEDPAGQRHLAGLLILGSVPAAVVGLGLEDTLERTFARSGIAAVCFFVTGAFLWYSRRLDPAGSSAPEGPHAGSGLGGAGGAALTPRVALLIGCAQALAILPGISRSGATIVAALALGLSLNRAAAFSFLLSIPAVGGAAILKLPDMLGASAPAQAPGITHLVLALVVTFLVGYLALGLLLKIARSRRLHWFAPYCWALGAIGVLGTWG
jgi:undecaprenyl-diphosphatase